MNTSSNLKLNTEEYMYGMFDPNFQNSRDNLDNQKNLNESPGTIKMTDSPGIGHLGQSELQEKFEDHALLSPPVGPGTLSLFQQPELEEQCDPLVENVQYFKIPLVHIKPVPDDISKQQMQSYRVLSQQLIGMSSQQIGSTDSKRSSRKRLRILSDSGNNNCLSVKSDTLKDKIKRQYQGTPKRQS